MPIPSPSQGESQNEYVGRCISDINEEYPNEQAVAICISNWQKTHMSKDSSARVAMKMEGIHLYQSYKESFSECDKMKQKFAENPELDYPHDMCVKDMTEKYGDTYTAERICKCIVDTYSSVKLAEEGGLEGACWEGYTAIGTKEKDGKMVPNCVPNEEVMNEIKMKGIELATYDWDTCVSQQTDRYGSKDIAEKVCGMIKSKYGGE